MLGDRGHVDLLAGRWRPGLAGRGGDERARLVDRRRASGQGREHRCHHPQCARRLDGEHAAHRHPALRNRRTEARTVAPLHPLSGHWRLSCCIRHPPPHRWHGGHHPNQPDATAVKLGGPLFVDLRAPNHHRRAVCHLDSDSRAFRPRLPRPSARFFRLPHGFGWQLIRVGERRGRAQGLVLAESWGAQSVAPHQRRHA